MHKSISPPLQILIASMAILSLAASVFPLLFSIFSLSHPLFAWQFFTYPFVESIPPSFNLILHIGFNLFLLWTFGTSLIERARPLRFFSLFFGSCLFAGALSTPLVLFLHQPLAGSTVPLYAILTSWMMLNPYSKILLFFMVPFQARWLLLGLIGSNLFLNLINGAYSSSVAFASSIFFGYLFTLITWRTRSPFSFLAPFEEFILRVLERKKKPSPQPKIFDIKSGEPVLGDEQFMDAMLERISKYGEDALTPSEKKRMNDISLKRKR